MCVGGAARIQSHCVSNHGLKTSFTGDLLADGTEMGFSTNGVNERVLSAMLRLVNEVMRAAPLAEADADGVRVPVVVVVCGGDQKQRTSFKSIV